MHFFIPTNERSLASRKQNRDKYLERSALDRDLMILQRALKNEVSLDESNDWRLLNVIEEYKHGIVDSLRVQCQHAFHAVKK